MNLKIRRMTMPLYKKAKEPLLSVLYGTNAQVIAEAATLWIRPSDLVIDCTYGLGNFWKVYQHVGPFIAHDTDPKKGDGVDVRALHLHHDENSIDVTILDLGYTAAGGRLTSTIPKFNSTYGIGRVTDPRDPMELQQVIDKGIEQCVTVLKKGGVHMQKSMNYVTSGHTFWGRDLAVATMEGEGLCIEDEFLLIRSHPGPQPKKNIDGTARRQVHSRKVHSYLTVGVKR